MEVLTPIKSLQGETSYDFAPPPPQKKKLLPVCPINSKIPIQCRFGG